MRDRCLPNAGVEIGNFSGGSCSCCSSGAGWSCFTWVLTFFRLPDFQTLVFYVGFRSFFGSGLFFRVFLLIFVVLTSQKCSFPCVFGALLRRIVQNLERKHIFSTCFMWVLVALLQKSSCFLWVRMFCWVSRASESRVSCGF